MLDQDASDLLASVRIASPCSVDWDTMTGDDKTRFCGECKLNVHNLSAMTTKEAEGLLKKQQNGERLCISFYRRADGTVLTQDCPVGIKLLQMKAKRAWNKVASFVSLFMCFGLSVQAQPGGISNSTSGCAAQITIHDLSLKTGVDAYDSKQYQKALKFFQEFCSKNPDNNEARYYFGLSFWALKQDASALSQFKILTGNNVSAEIRTAAQENIKSITSIKTLPKEMGNIAPPTGWERGERTLVSPNDKNRNLGGYILKKDK